VSSTNDEDPFLQVQAYNSLPLSSLNAILY